MMIIDAFARAVREQVHANRTRPASGAGVLRFALASGVSPYFVGFTARISRLQHIATRARPRKRTYLIFNPDYLTATFTTISPVLLGRGARTAYGFMHHFVAKSHQNLPARKFTTQVATSIG